MSLEQEDALIDFLRRVKEVLDTHGVEFWLDCGTLLGAVRDGKFIPWEHDLDFGAWREKVPKTVKVSVSKALCGRGFKVWIAENHMNIKKGDGLFVADINFYRLSGNRAIKPTLFPQNLLGRFLRAWLPSLLAPYHVGFSKVENLVKRFIINTLINISRAMPSLLRKRLAQIVSIVYEKIGSEDVSWIVPSRYFSDLLSMKFYDMEFKVPAETEEYLAYRYGKDWQVPKQDWVTARDDGTVIKSLK